MDIYLQGLSIGLAYVAPIGMQNIFVINTALTQPKSRSYITALITIFFDISLSLACFFGIGAIMQASKTLETVILLIGSIVVGYIGAKLMLSKSIVDTSKDVDMPLIKAISTAFVVTWINPQALIDGSLMLGAFRATLDAGSELAFVCGFASASVIWFLAETTFFSLFNARSTDKVLRVINIVCGAVMIFYSAKLLYSFILAVM